MNELSLIAALGKNREIGEAGQLPWRLPEDLKRFKRLTLGHAVIMGRKTFDSIGRALPERRNIVVSRAAAGAASTTPGVELASSIDEALRLARETDAAPIVIGGAEIYALCLPLATELRLTHVDREVLGADAFFPAFSLEDFEITSETPAETEGVRFVDYRRRGAARSVGDVAQDRQRG